MMEVFSEEACLRPVRDLTVLYSLMTFRAH